MMHLWKYLVFALIIPTLYRVQWSAGEYQITDHQWEKPANATNSPLDLGQLSVKGDTVCAGEPASVVIAGLPKAAFTEHLIDSALIWANDVYAVDIDRDGDLDAAAASSTEGIHWYENTGPDRYAKHALPTTATSTEQVFAIDIDQDADIDLLTASNFPIRPGIYWFENNGEQEFTERHIPVRNERAVENLWPVDMNRDGLTDVLVFNQFYVDTIVWYQNQGSGQFTERTFTTGNGMAQQTLYPADLNGDGETDIAAVLLDLDNVRYQLVWFQNDGEEAFTEQPVDLPTEFFSMPSLSVADIDSDGDADVIYTHWTPGYLTWHEQLGAGTFAKRLIDENLDRPPFVQAVDLDKDGDVDILSGSEIEDRIYLYENNGEQQFYKRTLVDSLDRPKAAFVTDADSDGDLDIYAAAEIGRKIAWYEQAPSPLPEPLSIRYRVDDGAAQQMDSLISSGDRLFLSMGVQAPGSHTIAIEELIDADDRRYPLDLTTTVVVQQLEADLGPDTTLLTGQSLTLDATVPGVTYNWSTGESTPMIQAPAGATYSVTLTNAYGCIVADTIMINARPYSDCRQTDSLALVDFYQATDGENWRRSWDLLEPINTWYGITIDEDGCVLNISLTNNQLVGQLSPTLTNLSKLEVINLDSNQLSGTIPLFLADIDSLQFLSLDFNNFTGEIPPELGQLEKLQVLDLAGNQLEGTIPPEIGQLSDLRFLSLFSNRLNGEIPPDFRFPVNLEYLSLFNNQLTGNIPSALSSCQKLRELYLDENDFHGSIPGTFTSLEALEIFRVSGNRLAGQTQDYTQSWPRIRQFYFQNNRFTFEDMIHFIDNMSSHIAGNRQVEWDQLIYAPQDSIFQDTLIVRSPGDTLTIDLGIDNEVASNVYTWYKGGQFYRTVNGENQLHFENLTVADTGVYHCQVTNPNAENLVLLSRAIQLDITSSALVFDVQTENVRCPGGSDGQASISIQGGLGPYLIEFEDGQRYEVTEDRLLLLDDLEAGQYRFTLSDQQGASLGDLFTIQQPDSLKLEEFLYQHDAEGDACTGSISLMISGGTPSYAIAWNDGGEGALRTGLCEEVYISTVTDANGCKETFPSIEINLFEVFSAEVIPSACPDDASGQIVLDVRGGDPPYRFTWKNTGGSPLPGNQSIGDLPPGSYSVTISEGSGNELMRTYAVEAANEDPGVQARDDEITITPGNLEQVLLVQTNDEKPADGLYTIELVSIPSIGRFQVRNDTIYYLPEPFHEGDLELTYRICDINCSNICDEAQVLIRHESDQAFFVPESISPNGDGLNDALIIPEIRDHPEKYPRREISIINRWGQVVYHARPYNNDWNGRGQNGKLLPAGTYYYIIRLDIGEGEIQRGSILLVR